ncbi:unnamed protein product [Lampetra planeri]
MKRDQLAYDDDEEERIPEAGWLCQSRREPCDLSRGRSRSCAPNNSQQTVDEPDETQKVETCSSSSSLALRAQNERCCRRRNVDVGQAGRSMGL